VRNGWLAVGAVVLLAVLLCTGGWSPLALVGVAGTVLAKVKIGAWLAVSLFSLCAGPLLLAWVFVKGPPARNDGAQLAGTVVLVLAGLALTVAALFKLPAVAAVLVALLGL
jgi:hypothetical protein